MRSTLILTAEIPFLFHSPNESPEQAKHHVEVVAQCTPRRAFDALASSRASACSWAQRFSPVALRLASCGQHTGTRGGSSFVHEG